MCVYVSTETKKHQPTIHEREWMNHLGSKNTFQVNMNQQEIT